MNPTVAEFWIDALLSGEYRQGFSALRTLSDTYCCLGVLTDLYIKTHKSSVQWDKQDERYYLFAGIHGYLAPEVQKWAEMRSDNGAIKNFSPPTLSAINDIGHTFETIAATIRKYQKIL